MTMKKLTPAERTAQANAWKHMQYNGNKDDIVAYREFHRKEEIARRSSCNDARMVKEVARRKQYNIDHAEHGKQYNIDHAEHIKAQQKQYKIDNAVAIKAQRKEHYEANKESILSNNRRYAREHSRDPRDYVLDPCKCLNLNDWFDGCRRHHVAANVIIHIPYDMHVTTYHNIRNGTGMAQINTMAFEFLFSE